MSKQRTVIRPVIKIITVVVVLAVGFMVMGYFMENPVLANKRNGAELEPRVEVVDLTREDYRVQVSAQGQVEAVTQTIIISEVAGAIEFISPKLKTGGRFAEGETLLKVSAADYQVQLAQALANVSDAELQIAQEEARAVQAMRDWKKLGRGGKPGKLVTREPQLARAKAMLEAAKANAVKAERDLGKTTLTAPYDCMVAGVSVDAGGYLPIGGRVAEVFTANKVKVRLPMSLEDVSFLPADIAGTPVVIRAEVGRITKDWQAKVMRSEGMIDRATHTMMMVAEMSASDGDGVYKVPPVGLFVKGMFEGEVFESAVKVPREALRSGGVVWLVDSANRLEMREVKVERSEREYVVITSGLQGGEKVITSPIELAVNGMKVEPVQRKSKAQD